MCTILGHLPCPYLKMSSCDEGKATCLYKCPEKALVSSGWPSIIEWGWQAGTTEKYTVVLRSVALLGQCQFSVQVMSSWVGTWEGAGWGPGKELGGDLGRRLWQAKSVFFLLC